MAIIECKPFEQMTLPELRAEYDRWVNATAPGAWARNYDKAHDCRDLLALWIERREREAMGAAA